MSYERLDFENRNTAVFVASGCGFKSPRSWGRRTVRKATPAESRLAESGLVRWGSALDKTAKLKLPGFDRDYKVNAMIEDEMKQLLNLDLQEEVDYLQTAVDNLDIQLMTASADASVILKSQQGLLREDLTESRSRLRAETKMREDRVEKLRGYDSLERKDRMMDDGDYRGTTGFGMVRENITALIAASFPAKPPSVWFDNPNFTGLSPLTIENSGQVRGHVASWKQAHIGMGGSVRAPKSRSEYAFFRTGALETDDGKMIDVGQITLAGGHASLDASVADAVAHYDNTDSAVMDVAVGEDRHGIWVAGSLRPGLPESDLRAIRASSVSGDWRPINGNLELVAVCAVNVPGFPIPRARVAAGAPVALIAAGTAELVQVAMEANLQMDIETGIQAGLTEVNARIEAIEARAANPSLTASEHRETIDAEIVELVAAADAREQATELRTRVHKEGIAASLRARVRPVVASPKVGAQETETKR